jgi:hypothetical protein
MLLAFPGRVKPSTTPPDDDSDLAVLLHLNPVRVSGLGRSPPGPQPSPTVWAPRRLSRNAPSELRGSFGGMGTCEHTGTTLPLTLSGLLRALVVIG